MFQKYIMPVGLVQILFSLSAFSYIYLDRFIKKQWNCEIRNGQEMKMTMGVEASSMLCTVIACHSTPGRLRRKSLRLQMKSPALI
jgi:hypothetical protein